MERKVIEEKNRVIGEKKLVFEEKRCNYIQK